MYKIFEKLSIKHKKTHLHSALYTKTINKYWSWITESSLLEENSTPLEIKQNFTKKEVKKDDYSKKHIAKINENYNLIIGSKHHIKNELLYKSNTIKNNIKILIPSININKIYIKTTKQMYNRKK